MFLFNGTFPLTLRFCGPDDSIREIIPNTIFPNECRKFHSGFVVLFFLHLLLFCLRSKNWKYSDPKWFLDCSGCWSLPKSPTPSEVLGFKLFSLRLWLIESSRLATVVFRLCESSSRLRRWSSFESLRDAVVIVVVVTHRLRLPSPSKYRLSFLSTSVS